MEDMILKVLRTKSEQRELINLIDNLLANDLANDLAFNSTNSVSKSPIETALSSTLGSFVNQSEKSKNKKEIETFLTSLRISVMKLEILKITLPFDPNEKTISKLKIWALENLPANTIYDINTDPDILGGAIIISNKGNYSDFTLSKKIDSLFLTKRDELLAHLLPVIPSVKSIATT